MSFSADNVIHMLPRAGAPPALLNVMAEQSLLGMLMTNPRLLQDLPPTFHPDHYAFDRHDQIHLTIGQIGKPGVPATLAVLQAIAANDWEMRTYIVGLLNCAVSMLPSAVKQHAELITELHRRRGLIALADAMREHVYAEGTASADLAIAKAMTGLEELTLGSGSASPTMSLDEAMDQALERADAAARGDGPSGVSTGMPSVDERLGGLDPGTLTVLGGRPGMGKSSLGLQWGINAARRGIGTLAVSLEMSAMELGRRALAVASGVPVSAMKHGRHAMYAERLLRARAELRGLPFTIEDGGGLTAGMIALKARAAKRRHGLGLVLVDHLHIVRPDDADMKSGATWAVGRVSGAMKRLAKEFECPVLLLAQLNRAVEARDDKRPGLSDLRQSGDIEQDADAVAFVYREEYYLGAAEPKKGPTETAEKFNARQSEWLSAKMRAAGRADLIVAKVRDGAPGNVPLMFHGETTSFSEPSDEQA